MLNQPRTVLKRYNPTSNLAWVLFTKERCLLGVGCNEVLGSHKLRGKAAPGHKPP